MAEVVVVVVMVVVVVDQMVHRGRMPACLPLPVPRTLAMQGGTGIRLLMPAVLPAGIEAQAAALDLAEDVAHVLEQLLVATAWL